MPIFKKKRVTKIDWKAFDGMTTDEIYRKHIKGWDILSDEDKELCIRVNKYRVEALCLPPIIHPDVVINEDYL